MKTRFSHFRAWGALALTMSYLMFCYHATISPAKVVPTTFDRDGLKRVVLDYNSRQLLNRAIANKWGKLPILVLARSGRNAAAAETLIELGGEVHFRADEIDYIRGILPTEKVNTYLEFDAVQDIRLGYSALDFWDLKKSSPHPLSTFTHQQTMKSSESNAIDSTVPDLSAKEMTAENPFLPTRDMGAPQFVKDHPGFDGRGVTIAVLEDGDLDHPTLRTARSLEGAIVSKIAGILNAYDPDHDEMVEAGFPFEKYAGMNDDPTLVRMSSKVEVKGVVFEQQEKQYVAPGPGAYRFGMWAIPSGDPDKTRHVAVLWDSARGAVWVDTNGNRDFSDEKPLRDFNRSHDLGYFPSSFGSALAEPSAPRFEPKSGQAEEYGSTAFAVTIDQQRQVVYIYYSSSDHGTMVASVAAGKGFLGGEANGAAPEAQIVYVHLAGNRLDRYIEGMLLAAKDPRVDLMSSSNGVNGRPEDGESLFCLAANRIVAKFKKPILQGAGNERWPGMEQVGGEAAASGVLGVGGYNDGSTRNAFYFGNRFVAGQDYVGILSANGPSSIGALKPDILAPNLEVAAMPCAQARRPEPEVNAAASFRMPQCYWVGGGTSSAAPFAAGAVALLISAAKQTHVPYDAENIYWAVRMSARHLPGYGIYRQGSGLIQVGEAWKLLQQSSKRLAGEILFSAPIRSPLSRYLKTPTEGVGLYENGGWTVGEQGVRPVNVLRRGGSPKALRCKLELIGNDGTFTIPDTISLPDGDPIEIAVHVKISAPGVHDAILRIVDAESNMPLGQTALTIIVGNALTRENNFSYDVHGVLKLEESQSVYVDVPPGASALKIQISVAKGNVHLFGIAPYFFGGWIFPREYLYPAVWTHLEPQPEPGIWHFRVDDWEHSHSGVDQKYYLRDATFTLHIEVQGAELASTGVANQLPKVQTHLAPLLNPVVIGHQGFLHEVRLNGRGLLPRVIDVDVPKGAEVLYLQLASEPPSDVSTSDLYLYDCEDNEKDYPCKLWDIRNARKGSGKVLVRWPEAGRWKLLIDPLSNAASRDSKLLEVIVGPSHGKATLESSQEGATIDRGWAMSESEWTPVNFLEAIDAASEREEELAPLSDINKYPRSDFVPIPLGISIARSRGSNSGRHGAKLID